MNDSGSENSRTKISITVIALALIVLQLSSQLRGWQIRVDAVTLALLILALLPWLSPWVESFKIGDLLELRTRVNRTERTLIEQRREIEMINFALANLLSRWEKYHLQELTGNKYLVRESGELGKEMKRLLSLGLIDATDEKKELKRSEDVSNIDQIRYLVLDEMLREPTVTGERVNAADYFQVTANGKRYLEYLNNLETLL